jgi:antitoxin (DNA-binding transcriptional repressor) of toxin-antitoxin stability system
MVLAKFTELRKNAKKYFDAVENGETVSVSRHGKVIARIVPETEPIPQKRKLPQRLVMPGISFTEAILKDRDENR